jgi:hypothetical protein
MLEGVTSVRATRYRRWQRQLRLVNAESRIGQTNGMGLKATKRSVIEQFYPTIYPLDCQAVLVAILMGFAMLKWRPDAMVGERIIPNLCGALPVDPEQN